ncbi:unnamed protein product [Merluccius merluccius]
MTSLYYRHTTAASRQKWVTTRHVVPCAAPPGRSAARSLPRSRATSRGQACASAAGTRGPNTVVEHSGPVRRDVTLLLAVLRQHPGAPRGGCGPQWLHAPPNTGPCNRHPRGLTWTHPASPELLGPRGLQASRCGTTPSDVISSLLVSSVHSSVSPALPAKSPDVLDSLKPLDEKLNRPLSRLGGRGYIGESDRRSGVLPTSSCLSKMAAPVLAVRTALLSRCLRTFPSLNPPAAAAAAAPARRYHPRPLRLDLTGPYLPDRAAAATPDWQRTDKFARKLYGRHGDASGIEPATLWPSDHQLEELRRDEAQWQPPLDVMLDRVRVREESEAADRRAKEKLIAANMAKMPKMVADWRRERRAAKIKVTEEKVRRNKLLAVARERLGYTVDPRSLKFQEMVAEVEKEQKKNKKLQKRQQKEEQAATPLAAADE